MLPKKYRLPTNQVLPIIRFGSRKFSGNLKVSFKQNNLGVSRFTIIISKKAGKLAVTRNRNKRVISASIYRNIPRMSAGFDCVIQVIQDCSKISPEEVDKQTCSLFT
jgi:ribonuclease P protein component